MCNSQARSEACIQYIRQNTWSYSGRLNIGFRQISKWVLKKQDLKMGWNRLVHDGF